MSVKVEQTYISAGANRSSSCSASTSSGLLAYGAGHLVALWNADPSSSKGVHSTLAGHGGIVTTVKLLKDEDGQGSGAAFISGDALGNVRVWRQGRDGRIECEVSFDAHPQSSISALAVCPPGPLENHVLTGASDGLVKLWNLSGSGAKLVQTIDLRGKLPLDMEVAQLPGSTAPVLVLGCTDRRIQIYTLKDTSLQYAFSLEGHEDWIRCLAITPYPSSSSKGDSPDLLLASGSQDNYVRLWRISPMSEQASQATGDVTSQPEASGSGNALDMLDEFERKLAGEAGYGGSVQISTKAHVLAVESGGSTQRFNVTLEALLMGHEGGLTNLHWSPLSSAANPHLLSTASDNSIIIWTPSSPDSSDGIWIPAHRFGALGGRGLSFFGAVWGKDARSVLASGWNGGWERWVRTESEGEMENWEPKVGVMGHWEDVRGLEWSPGGEYLMSVSSDQTTRIHAATNLPSSASSSSSQPRWAEIARPQIHGYDLTCAAWLSPYRFASGADEKVTRVFDAPGGFVESLGSLGVRDLGDEDIGERPKGATVPPLGLSNRALGRAFDATIIPTSHHAQDSVSRAMTALPTEEELATSTLWPEIEKVYGHGYELVSMAASHSGTLLATSCRATTAEHAVVRLVSTSSWDTIAVLSGHSLTVTRIQFSPDDRYILTCSRDRGWRVFGRSEEGEDGEWGLVCGDEKAHARMVLDACWLKGGSGGFVTVSRDKTVKIWMPDTSATNPSWTLGSSIKLDEGICAVDAVSVGRREILAVGTESGKISLYELTIDGGVKETLLQRLDSSISHVQAITRLAFRPGKREGEGVELASCSDDRSVRVFSVTLGC